MTNLEFLSFLRQRQELAISNRDNAVSDQEECYWDGQVAALRDVLAMVEVQLLAIEQRGYT